jgi:hypothetical protein
MPWQPVATAAGTQWRNIHFIIIGTAHDCLWTWFQLSLFGTEEDVGTSLIPLSRFIYLVVSLLICCLDSRFFVDLLLRFFTCVFACVLLEFFTCFFACFCLNSLLVSLLVRSLISCFVINVLVIFFTCFFVDLFSTFFDLLLLLLKFSICSLMDCCLIYLLVSLLVPLW